MTVNTDEPLQREDDGEDPIDVMVTVSWMPLPAILPAQDVWVLTQGADGRWAVLSTEQRVLSYAARTESWSTRISTRENAKDAGAVMRECCAEPGQTAVLLASGQWGLLGTTAFVDQADADAAAAEYNYKAAARVPS